MTDTLIYLATAYMCMAFIKFMLCVPQTWCFIAVMSRMAGHPKGHIMLRYLIIAPVMLAVSSILMWLPALYREGFHFFDLYNKRAVMRGCVLAHRAGMAHSIPEEKS